MIVRIADPFELNIGNKQEANVRINQTTAIKYAWSLKAYLFHKVPLR